MRRKINLDRKALVTWIARAALAGVFAINLGCAISFIARPEQYASGFELDDFSGKITVQALGILFLMWNATYPPVLGRPNAHKTLFGVILVQQALGLAGETWLWLELPSGHPALWSTGLRFIVFDGIGLVLMGMAYVLLWTTLSSRVPGKASAGTQVDSHSPIGQ